VGNKVSFLSMRQSNCGNRDPTERSVVSENDRDGSWWRRLHLHWDLHLRLRLLHLSLRLHLLSME
jgi:hypothetical protein